MEVKHISGIRFASGWTSESERNLTVGPSVFTQIIVNHYDVFSLIHEVLTDRTSGIRSEVLIGDGIARGSRHDDRVRERVVSFQIGNHLGNTCGLLANRDIDTNDIFSSLIDDGIDSNRR